MKNLSPDHSWTLFLDRDGVLNRKIENGYVTHAGELEILPRIPEALAALRSHFGLFVIVTNQQGIGKGLMSEKNFHEVMQALRLSLREAGADVDAVYHCPHLKTAGCDCRKPLTGMALQAQQRFPQIDFARSVMVGDSLTDMALGRSLGMVTVGVGPDAPGFDPAADFVFWDLKELADFLRG